MAAVVSVISIVVTSQGEDMEHAKAGPLALRVLLEQVQKAVVLWNESANDVLADHGCSVKAEAQQVC